VITAALIERDHVAALAGFVLRLFLDLRHDGATSFEGFLIGSAGLDRGVHARGHVLNAHEHVQFEVWCFDFLGECLCVESFLEVIVLLRAHLLQRVRADVVVGENQSVCGDEFARAAAVEAQGRFLQMLQPFVRDLKIVALFQLFARWVAIEPHPLVGEAR
jgi:hypothetical protein